MIKPNLAEAQHVSIFGLLEGLLDPIMAEPEGSRTSHALVSMANL
jgi:hypothetical protein